MIGAIGENARIHIIEHCVELIKTVRPKSYIRNDIESSRRRIGFIAQEMQAGASGDLGVVIGQGGDGDNESYLTIDYARLTPLLWSTCQNLLARVEQLESHVKSNAQARARRTKDTTAHVNGSAHA